MKQTSIPVSGVLGVWILGTHNDKDVLEVRAYDTR